MQLYQIVFSKKLVLAAISGCSLLLIKTDAAELRAPDELEGALGVETVIDAGNCLASSGGTTVGQVTHSGACYFFRSFETGPVVDTEEVKLVPSDPTSYDLFGRNLALSGNLALISKYAYPAYLYRNLNTAKGTVTEDAKFDSYRGFGVSLSGTNGLIGTSFYRHLDQVAGLNPIPDSLLRTSTVEAVDFETSANSLSGNSALAGTIYDPNTGYAGAAAFYYHDLSTAGETVTEDAKLIPPVASRNGQFGSAVSLSGNRALVAAPELDIDNFDFRGAVYYFRNLDTATGVVVAQTQLQANPANLKQKSKLYLGSQVSLSGEDALVSSDRGSAYLFLNLDQASGTVYEDVQIYTSYPPELLTFNNFGLTVSLDGDKFAIGDSGRDFGVGVVYTGSVSALTTNDFGNSSEAAAYVSFTSHLDWVAGETTDNNRIPLTAGDTATVLDVGKAVYIGKNAGSDNNLLDIAGTLNASFVYIGAVAGNTGNTLQVASTGQIAATALRLAKGNRLLIAGSPAAAKTFLQTAPLQVWVSNGWKTITLANYQRLVSVSQTGGYTVIVPL